MSSKQVHPAFVIGTIVILLAVIGLFFWQSTQATEKPTPNLHPKDMQSPKDMQQGKSSAQQPSGVG